MPNKLERISLLSEMIAFSRPNIKTKPISSKFLLSIAKQLKISNRDFKYLVRNPINYKQIDLKYTRLVQFYRLIFIMNTDANIKPNIVYDYGLKMGLNHEMVTKTLYLINEFPDNTLPCNEILIEAYKVYYN